MALEPIDQMEEKTQNNDNKRVQFGNRYLTDESEVFEQNAWDDIQWDEALKQSIDSKIKQNSMSKVSEEKRQQLEEKANHFWDQFYNKHENKFFKDRHWLFTEFPQLRPTPKDPNEDNEVVVLEVGCGVGNTVFPVLEINSNPNLFIYCCDFSSTAIELVKENPLYDENRCKAFTLDITSDEWTVPFPKSSLNIVTMIFVLSAIDPNRMQDVINKIYEYLKPNGLLLFRDYGRYDMTQVRFKDGHCLKDNFYMRGDGTRAYFFTEEEIDSMFTRAGLKKTFLRSDKRLQVNRAKHIKMYRVWVQANYYK